MRSKGVYRAGIEMHHHFQNELSRLENEGYNAECFSSELMDAIYLEILDYWRNEAMFASLGLTLSRILEYVDELIEENGLKLSIDEYGIP